MTVTIYSTPTCTHCNSAKTYFKNHNINYQEFDVASDPEKRKEMVEKSGQLGVPVIEIGDQILVGFDEEAIESMLKDAGGTEVSPAAHSDDPSADAPSGDADSGADSGSN